MTVVLSVFGNLDPGSKIKNTIINKGSVAQLVKWKIRNLKEVGSNPVVFLALPLPNSPN